VRPVPILLYHGVADEASPGIARYTLTPRVFDAHMAHLVDAGYRALTVSELLVALNGSPEQLPERPVLITFDDGLRNFLTEALPIMERHGLSSTLYAATSYLGEGDAPGVHASGDPGLAWSELVSVAAGGVEVGAHTHTHPMLDTLPHAAARAEIVRGKELIEQHTQAPVASFAYPHGYSSAWVRRAVQEAGYSSACAVKNAVSHLGDDPFALARLMLEAGHSMEDFRRMLSGDGVRAASSGDQLMTRGWRLARRGLAAGHRLRPGR